MSDGFLGRWSRRKQEARTGLPPAEPPAESPQGGVFDPAQPDPPPETQAATAAAPLPTLADAQALTLQSDFAPFASRAVAPEVRNAAMKQLFRDPHFNVMDGLDTYIDDYSVADPLPLSVLRQMASAEFVGLVRPEESIDGGAPHPDGLPVAEPTDPAPFAASEKDPDSATVAQWEPHASAAPAALDPPPANASQTPHAHAHLRLQPNDAAPEDRSGHGDR